jgi:hypothetical protein
MQNKFRRKRSSVSNEENYYSLVFNLQIDAYESIYVAYNEPYTYTRLGAKLDSLNLQTDSVSRSIICRTPLGNRVEMITLTKKTSHTQKRKKIIFITARMHPAETAGSFVM